MPRIIDNINLNLVKCLNETINLSFKSDFCVGYFNLRGWDMLDQYIERFKGGDGNCCRLMIGMQRMPQDLMKEIYSQNEHAEIDTQVVIRRKKELAEEFRNQLTIGIPTEQDEKTLRDLSRQLKEKKVVVKLYLRSNLHAKLYLLHREDPINPKIGYVGSSNLTLSGLKLQGELNVDVLDHDATLKLEKWFEDRWNDKWCIDITEELIGIIDNSWASEELRSPYHIYLKMVYHLSQEARAGLSQYKVPKIFRDILLLFQDRAVSIAAHHLKKRGGVLIGDVVGLGKTLTATAIAAIFEEEEGLETLILCPKNLEEMWQGYIHKYRLRAVTLSLSRVQRELPKLRRYRLVIIDESHNLRNREGKRYRAIQEYIQLNDSKVVLLTATPYNKTYLDLSNQLRLFIQEDKELGITPERFIESIGGRVQFMSKYPYSPYTIQAFEKSIYPDDWRELMRLYMVRRPRSFIKQNYSQEDPVTKRKYLTFSDGTRSYFPDRIPRRIEYEFDEHDPNDQYAKLYSDRVVDIINQLKLPRYGLGNFLDALSVLKATPDEEVIIANLSRAGTRLMGFCRTNLFKRLESSGYAFLTSISRHILRNFIFIYAIENDLPFPIGTQEANWLDVVTDDEDDASGTQTESVKFNTDLEEYLKQAGETYKKFAGQFESRFDWIRSGLFTQSLKNLLIDDCKKLIRVFNIVKEWNANDDRHLERLYQLCTKDFPKEKILIFTQFADTANYLSDNLKKRGVKSIEAVTGEMDHPTGIAHRFSPLSNERKEIAGTTNELRIVVTTDVLSEGQNLQDCHIVVNYDLPWAIIRLIQRAGRIDRIGQKSDKIFCYSFLPADGIERIINLRGRLRQRIRENAEVVGADEVFFEGDPIQIHAIYNEDRSVLEEDDDTEVDLSSFAYQLWKNATDEDPTLKKIIPDLPNVVYATKHTTSDNPDKKDEGVLVYTRTAEENDVLAMVDLQGGIITQSQLKILKVAECTPATEALHKIPEHHTLVEKGMIHIHEIEKTIGGQLGKKSGAKYRTFMRLSRYYEANKDTLFVTEALKKAIDEVYKYPLREFARDIINRKLKEGIDDEELSNLVISLREEDKLCIVHEEELAQREPQIICSMGIRH